MSFNTDISSKLEKSRYVKVLIFYFTTTNGHGLDTAFPLHVALCRVF